MKKLIALTAALALLGISFAVQAAITIDTVAVGDVGNAGELSGGGNDRICGSVDYTYNIGKYEVTAGHYTAFLNAVASTDTYALYNTQMSRTDYGSGITRSGTNGNYAYSVDSDFVNRPVNYVSFWDSCRFANWLGNGQKTGAQDTSTTEDGAYTLTASGITNNSITRNVGWKWAVTSEDEWYKAAYYKGGGIDTGYWLYPTGSNTAPGRDLTDASGNNANYYGEPYPILYPKYTTVVGEFQNSDSHYGTFDQGGNVWEWNEAIIEGSRGLRGGGFEPYSGNSVDALLASPRHGDGPTSEHLIYGFRVTQAVPEPSSIITLAGGSMSLLIIRRRRTRISL